MVIARPKINLGVNRQSQLATTTSSPIATTRKRTSVYLQSKSQRPNLNLPLDSPSPPAISEALFTIYKPNDLSPRRSYSHRKKPRDNSSAVSAEKASYFSLLLLQIPPSQLLHPTLQQRNRNQIIHLRPHLNLKLKPIISPHPANPLLQHPRHLLRVPD